MRRQAIMIMAHNQFDLLEMLIRSLDHEEVDFYLHVDSKSTGFDVERFDSLPVHASIRQIPRQDVRWGTYRVIDCELALLRAARSRPHSYYHLISGADFPVRPVREILEFFESHEGTEFIHFSPQDQIPAVTGRASLFHPLQRYLRRPQGGRRPALRIVNRLILDAQRLVGVNRLRNVDFELKFGANWFSVTEAFVDYVLERESWIRDHFSHSLCASELFIQTLAYNSPFRAVLSESGDLRIVDWQRGDGDHPHVWRIDDLDHLLASEGVFARKFDLNVDAQIVDAIFRANTLS